MEDVQWHKGKKWTKSRVWHKIPKGKYLIYNKIQCKIQCKL